jgi:hypothetical protein
MDLITFSCDSCHQVLKVGAENAGKQAKCPRCGAAMIIPSASPPPAGRRGRAEDEEVEDRPARPRPRREDDYEEEDRPRRRRREEDYEEEDRPRRARRREEDYEDEDDRDRPRRRPDRYEDEGDDYDRPRRKGMSERKKWGFVKLGILLVAISACLIATYALLQAVTDVLLMIQSMKSTPEVGSAGTQTAFKVIGRIGHGFALAGALVALVGYVFCMFVPNKHGTLAFAIVALALGGVNLVFDILCKLVPMFDQAGALALIMPGLGIVKLTSQGAFTGAFILSIFEALLYYAQFIVFALFLWAASRAARDRWVGPSAMGLVVFGSVTAALKTVALVMMFVYMNSTTKPKALGIITTILTLVATLVFLGQMVWYILVLFRARDISEA